MPTKIHEEQRIQTRHCQTIRRAFAEQKQSVLGLYVPREPRLVLLLGLDHLGRPSNLYNSGRTRITTGTTPGAINHTSVPRWPENWCLCRPTWSAVPLPTTDGFLSLCT